MKNSLLTNKEKMNGAGEMSQPSRRTVSRGGAAPCPAGSP
jgi:hypothetical protein